MPASVKPIRTRRRMNSRASARGRLFAPDELRHRRDVVAPVGDSRLKVAFTAGGELVELGASIVLGDAPVAVDQPALLESVQREIQRAILDDQRVAGSLLDPSRDTVTVLRSPREHAKHEEVE